MNHFAYANVRGFCPECGDATLVVDIYEWKILCNNEYCDRPNTLDRIICDSEIYHIAYFYDDDTFTLKHPLKERLNDDLAKCAEGEYLFNLAGPPVSTPGKYRMTPTSGGGYFWALLEERH